MLSSAIFRLLVAGALCCGCAPRALLWGLKPAEIDTHAIHRLAVRVEGPEAATRSVREELMRQILARASFELVTDDEADAVVRVKVTRWIVVEQRAPPGAWAGGPDRPPPLAWGSCCGSAAAAGVPAGFVVPLAIVDLSLVRVRVEDGSIAGRAEVSEEREGLARDPRWPRLEEPALLGVACRRAVSSLLSALTPGT